METNTCQERRWPPTFLKPRLAKCALGDRESTVTEVTKRTLRNCPSCAAYGLYTSKDLTCLFHPNGQNGHRKRWSHLSSSRRMSSRSGHTHSSGTDTISKPLGHDGAKPEEAKWLCNKSPAENTGGHLAEATRHLSLKAASLICFKHFKGLPSSGSSRLCCFLKGLMLTSRLLTNG